MATLLAIPYSEAAITQLLFTINSNLSTDSNPCDHSKFGIFNTILSTPTP